MPPGREPETAVFADDGALPNSPLPTILYRSAIATRDDDPAAAFEQAFAGHGWTNSWRDGIFQFHHYHSTAHEVLGVASGHATVRLGGMRGHDVELRAGDVLALPAGVGHKRVAASRDFLIVGAYPEGRDYDVLKPYGADRQQHDAAAARIARLPLPEQDPVFGWNGPLRRLWRAPSASD